MKFGLSNPQKHSDSPYSESDGQPPSGFEFFARGLHSDPSPFCTILHLIGISAFLVDFFELPAQRVAPQNRLDIYSNGGKTFIISYIGQSEPCKSSIRTHQHITGSDVTNNGGTRPPGTNKPALLIGPPCLL